MSIFDPLRSSTVRSNKGGMRVVRLFYYYSPAISLSLQLVLVIFRKFFGVERNISFYVFVSKQKTKKSKLKDFWSIYAGTLLEVRRRNGE